MKDSGFSLPVEEVTDSTVAPQRVRRPSRRRPTGRRRTTTTAAPTEATAEPTEGTQIDTEETELTTTAAPVRPFRRRRPTGRGGFRTRTPHQEEVEDPRPAAGHRRRRRGRDC